MSFKMKKVLIFFSVIAAVSFIIAGLLYYFTGGLRPVTSSKKTISQLKEIDVSGIKLISISTISTPIKIITNKNNKLFANFGGEVFFGSNNKIPELDIQKDGTELKIKINYPVFLNFGSYDIADLKLEIKIPEDFNGTVITNTTSAKIDIQGINADELKIDGVSGMVNINNVKANYIEIDNTSGKCSIGGIKAKTFIDTISGEVFLDILELSNDIEVKAVSGTVKVKIPESSSFDFDLSSISGEIKNNVKSVIDFADRQSLKGKAGDGGAEINIDTVSGNIVLDYK